MEDDECKSRQVRVCKALGQVIRLVYTCVLQGAQTSWRMAVHATVSAPDQARLWLAHHEGTSGAARSPLSCAGTVAISSLTPLPLPVSRAPAGPGQHDLCVTLLPTGSMTRIGLPVSCRSRVQRKQCYDQRRGPQPASDRAVIGCGRSTCTSQCIQNFGC
jgi:hypothetical protein